MAWQAGWQSKSKTFNFNNTHWHIQINKQTNKPPPPTHTHNLPSILGHVTIFDDGNKFESSLLQSLNKNKLKSHDFDLNFFERPIKFVSPKPWVLQHPRNTHTYERTNKTEQMQRHLQHLSLKVNINEIKNALLSRGVGGGVLHLSFPLTASQQNCQ